MDLTGKYDPKKFVAQVPDKDASGFDMPPWKRLIVARQMAEKAHKEEMERQQVLSESCLVSLHILHYTGVHYY